MAARIFLYRFNTEQITTGFLLNELCKILVIAQNLTVHYNTAGSGNRIYAIRFRHGKISN